MAKTYTTQDVLIDVNALKEYKSKSDEALEQKIQEVQGDVTSKGESLSSLQETVQSQGSSIATNTSNIQKNTEALEKKVDKVEGSSLATTAQLAQIETNKNGVTSNASEIAALKTDKADKSQLTGLATESYVDEKISSLGDIKGSCLKSELEGKKAECSKNDVYIVTDDNNHMYFYNGTDFIDTNAVAHVDLSNYYDKGTIDSSLSNKVDKVEGSSLATAAQLTQIETNKTNITNLQSGKVDKVEGSSLITAAQLAQIETNKSTLETVQAAVSTLQTQNQGIDSFLEEYV